MQKSINDILKNNLLKQLIYLLFFFILITFILFIFLKNEKPGFISIKNNYIIFFLALLPLIILSFSYNYFHYYIQENLAKYIQNILYNSLFFKNINDIQKTKEDYNNIIAIQSILFTTLILATSYFFSMLSKFILEKGIIKFKDDNKIVKNNFFFNFLGILIGGVFYMIFYFLFLYNKHPITRI